MEESHPRLRRLAASLSPALALGPGREPFGAMPTEPAPARRVRATFRLTLVLLWTALACTIQAVLLLFPGRAKARFARFYWNRICRLLGLRVRVLGEVAGGAARPVVFVSNHSSWLDIPTLGGQLLACFVSKGEVATWPVVGMIARLGRTVYVTRRAQRTAEERDAMRRRLAEGDNLILFPEGTSSDGSRVLPFRTSFFSLAEGEPTPLIQPVSVVYDRLGGLPTGRGTRPVFAWYGDMDLAPHIWRLAQAKGLRATVLLHPPLDPAGFRSRKELCRAAEAAVADGASLLRQNRPPRPVAPPERSVPRSGSGTPAAAPGPEARQDAAFA